MAFYNCTNLTTVQMGNNVECIEDNAFNGCSSLKHIQFSDTLTSIGDSSFFNCGLMSILIPDSVTTIGIGAFRSCSLVDVTLGANITSIGASAFFGCHSLENVYCKAVNPPSIDSEVFYQYNGSKPNCILYGLKAIYVPYESVDTYKSANGWRAYKDLIVGYDFGE